MACTYIGRDQYYYLPELYRQVHRGLSPFGHSPADEKPENNFYTRFYTVKVRLLGVLVLYPVAILSIEKVCIIKNFEEANCSDSKRLVMNLKINPQKYNWPQTTCILLNNTFAGSNWIVIVMRIEHSEVYDTV